MAVDDPVSVWIKALEGRDSNAASNLWNHFCGRIQSLARTRLDALTRRVYDEHDAANSAFHSLCKGIESGRFSDLNDRDNLWRLLTVITARKVSQQKRAARRQKRGGGMVRGDSVFLQPIDSDGIDEIAAREPTPEFVAAVAESFDLLLASLADETLRRIAIWKFEELGTYLEASKADLLMK